MHRVRGAGTVAHQEGNSQLESCSSVKLFDDCAFHDRANRCNQFVLGRVQRIRRKGRHGYLEDIRPAYLDQRRAEIEILFSKYIHHAGGEAQGYSHLEENNERTNMEDKGQRVDG